MGELAQPIEQSLRVERGFEDDDVGRRRVSIGLDRGRRASHGLLDLGLDHPSVRGCGADQGGDLRRLAESLNRDARHRVDLVACMAGRFDANAGVGHRPLPPIGVSSVDHAVVGSRPCRTSWIARVRMATSDGPSVRGWTKSRGSSTWAATTDWVAQPKLSYGLVLPSFERRSRSEVLRPQPAGGPDLRFEAHEGHPDRRCAIGLGKRVGAYADPAAQTSACEDPADFVDRSRVRAHAARGQDNDFARAELAVPSGEGAQARDGALVEHSAEGKDVDVGRRRSHDDRMARLEIARKGWVRRGIVGRAAGLQAGDRREKTEAGAPPRERARPTGNTGRAFGPALFDAGHGLLHLPSDESDLPGVAWQRLKRSRGGIDSVDHAEQHRLRVARNPRKFWSGRTT